MERFLFDLGFFAIGADQSKLGHFSTRLTLQLSLHA